MSRRLDDARLAVLMLDALEIVDGTHVVALGSTTDGVGGSDTRARARRTRPSSAGERPRRADPSTDRVAVALRQQIGDVRRLVAAAGMLAAEQQLRRISGYGDLANLVIAIERHAILAAQSGLDQEAAEPVPI
jgi:hypothetical protein